MTKAELKRKLVRGTKLILTYTKTKGLTEQPREVAAIRSYGFDLRAGEGERLRRTNGYYADSMGDTVLTPIVARLPHSRGFLAGWTMGKGMLAAVEFTVHETAREAALAAYDMAESDAERQREAEEEEQRLQGLGGNGCLDDEELEEESEESELSECDNCGAMVAEIVGCPDGAEICNECFSQGAH